MRAGSKNSNEIMDMDDDAAGSSPPHAWEEKEQQQQPDDDDNMEFDAEAVDREDDEQDRKPAFRLNRRAPRTAKGLKNAAVEGFQRMFGTRSSNSNKRKQPPKTKKKVVPGLAQFDRMVQLANYEIQYDVYRGIMSVAATGQEEEGEPPCPWKCCSVGFKVPASHHHAAAANNDDSDSDCRCVNDSSDDDDGDDTTAASHKLVATASQSACPSLLHWSDEAHEQELKRLRKRQAQRKRKRGSSAATNTPITAASISATVSRHLGRPEDDVDKKASNKNTATTTNNTPVHDPLRCACDYNPFCLVSLGGVMNQALRARLPVMQRPSRQESSGTQSASAGGSDNNSGGGDDPMEVVVLDDDGATTSATKTSSDPNEKENNDNGKKEAAIKKKSKSQPNVVTIDDHGEGSTAVPALYDPYHSDSLYTRKTAQKLQELRQHVDCQAEPIRTYLTTLLKDMTGSISVDECLDHLEEQHRKLIFVNPLLQDDGNNNTGDDDRKKPSASSKRILRLSLPPGIENLGATCYLNTQLQCLAQNRIFCQGILSWQPPAASNNTVGATKEPPQDRMTTVISLFQQLLARMTAGPSAVLNTVEFSNALGLDHFEQQDPNEFSRLFFDKLHEAFQPKNGSNGSSSGFDLRTLLPHLFQGITAYETTCMHCNAKSVRKEEFMDLNLPILDVATGGARGGDNDDAKDSGKVKKKKKGQQQLDVNQFKPGGSSNNKKKDIDVQDCLDSTCRAEMLEGENQYLCSECNCKRDATRQTTFEKLPPVLNIQLSRYVFDRATLMKKKLENQILLPTELSVPAKLQEHHGSCSPSKAAADTTGVQQHRYVLTAVMRHQGKSAYSGHYVAEAMDWLTGQWFEFNDQQVSSLELGPSCSFDPTVGKAAAAESASSFPKGSKDAYNLYYVEENFLAQSALESLRAGKQELQTSRGDAALTQMEQMALERSTRYADVAQLCLEDSQLWNRLESRRKAILDSMLPGIFSPPTNEPGGYVWVDAEELRLFISCRDLGADGFLVGKSLPLQYERLLCSHATPGLHPRIARKGKLLPKNVYDAYESLLRKEVGDDAKLKTNHIITPDNMRCVDCSDDYRRELLEKMELAGSVRRLYHALDPKEDFPLQLGANEMVTDDSDHAFIVSRKFVTWFRKQAERLIKPATAIEGSKRASEISSSGVDVETLAEGLDALDMSCLELTEASGESSDPSSDETGVCVNGSISCKHRECSVYSKRIIRYITLSAWLDIKALYPKAIEHKVQRIKHGQVENLESCALCEVDQSTEKEALERLSSRLNAIAKIQRKEVLSCDSLVEKVKEKDPNGSERFYRLLHEDDLHAWNTFMNAAKRKSKVDEKTRDLLLPAQQWDCSDILSVHQVAEDEPVSPTSQSNNFLSSVVRPIACGKHRLPIAAAVLQEIQGGGPWPHHNLNDRLCILSEDSYQRLTSEWVSLSSEFLGTEASSTIEILDDDDECSGDDPSSNRGGLKWYHPRIVCHPVSVRKEDDPPSIAVTTASQGVLFRLDSCVCKDPQCNQSYSDWQTAEEAAKLEARVSKTQKAAPPVGAAADDPIPIDCDNDTSKRTSTTVLLKLYEVKKGSEMDAILEDLSMSTELPGSGADASQFLRRSTRKRKPRFPSGVILSSEDSFTFDLESNLAALRLSLLERCSNGSPFELSHTIHLVLPIPKDSTDHASPTTIALDGSDEATPTSPDSSSRVIPLPLCKSSDTLEKVLNDSLGEEGLPLGFIDLVLVRQADEDSGIEDTPKDALLDYLIGLSSSASGSKGKKRKQARVERGFSGTLLGSDRPAGESENTKADDDSDEDQVQVVGTSNVASVSGGSKSPKRRRSDSHDNEEKKDSPAGEEPVQIGTSESRLGDVERANSDLPTKETKTTLEGDRVARAYNIADQMMAQNPVIDGSKSSNEARCIEAAIFALSDGSKDMTDHGVINRALSRYIERMEAN